MDRSTKQIITYAAAGLAAVVIIATICATADAKKERYLIENPGTPEESKYNSTTALQFYGKTVKPENRETVELLTNGGRYDQRTKAAMAIPGSIDPGFYRPDDCILQNGDRRIQSAGDSKGTAGHEKRGAKAVQSPGNAGF